MKESNSGVTARAFTWARSTALRAEVVASSMRVCFGTAEAVPLRFGVGIGVPHS